jgi:uncharacterized protein (TIGR03032 family)
MAPSQTLAESRARCVGSPSMDDAIRGAVGAAAVSSSACGPSDQPSQPVRFRTRGDFVAILDRFGLSLVAAAQPNRLIFLGAVDGQLTTNTTLVSNPMGLAVDAGRLAVATAHSILVFGNASRLAPLYPARPDYYDAYFLPRTIHLTGGCRTHDIVFARHAIIAANAIFSCICRIDGSSHFTPLWRPSFISALRAEDRCHLNGFTGQNEELCYVTALAATDTPWGWRKDLYTSGVLIDARRNTILRSDLCMPHSPRLVGDDLYLLNGGKGEVLRIDRGTGESIVTTRLPGFVHGLCHHGGVLFVGMSQERISRSNSDAPPVAGQHPSLVAGIAAIDAKSGNILGAVEFDGVTEVFDIQPLSGVRRAGMQSLVAGDEYDGVEAADAGFWMKKTDHTPEAAVSGNYQIRLDIKL